MTPILKNSLPLSIRAQGLPGSETCMHRGHIAGQAQLSQSWQRRKHQSRTFNAVQVIDMYRSSDSGEEKRQCLAALGKAKSIPLLSEAIDFILESGEVRERTRSSRHYSTCTLEVRICTVRPYCKAKCLRALTLRRTTRIHSRRLCRIEIRTYR